MKNQSNPAGRLHNILQSAVGGDPNLRLLEVWTGVFGIAEPDDIIVTRNLLALNDTVGEVERLIKINPNLNHSRYLAGFPNIRAAIRPIYLQSTRQGVISNNLTTEVLARLEFCDEELQRYFSEESISQEDLSAITESTAKLFELIAASVQDATLRVVLLEGLEKVQIALSLYKIHGAKGLKSSLQNLLGIVFTEQTAIKEEKEKNADVIAKLGSLLDKLDSFSAKALKIHKVLTKPVRSFLSWIAKDTGDAASTGIANAEDVDAIET
jgi:hypothetical protein